MGAPNIFDYATSELSQDAFLCWLIACADCDDASLKNLGLEFIRFLYDSKNADTQQTKVQGLVKTKDTEKPYPWQQYGKIDVYFQATINDKKVSFVIEDKTGTAMHDDQLKRYATFVAEDGIEEDEVQLIYFKTGYVFPDELDAAKTAHYSVINLGEFVDFLKMHEKNIKNDVFRSYFTYVEKMSGDREEILEAVCNFPEKEDDYSRIFGNLFAQYHFMTMLKEKIKDVAGKYSDQVISRGKEIGGPWTILDLYVIPREDQGKGENEHLFWRLDEWYQLRLRHSGFDVDRSERLVIFRKIFEDVGGPIFNEAFRPPTGRTGRNSSVGEIQFNSAENSVRNILARMPEFHEEFIRRIESDQLLSEHLHYKSH